MLNSFLNLVESTVGLPQAPGIGQPTVGGEQSPDVSIIDNRFLMANHYIELNIRNVIGNVYEANVLKNILAYIENIALNADLEISDFCEDIVDIITQKKFYAKQRYSVDTPPEITDVVSFLSRIQAGYKDILWQTYFAFCANTKADPLTRQELLEYIRVINVLEKLLDAGEGLTTMSEVKALMRITPILPRAFAKTVSKTFAKTLAKTVFTGFSDSPMIISGESDTGLESGSVRPVGMGVVYSVKQTLEKYEMGEVAHIENVLLGESKERTYRVLDKTEESYESETETEKLESKDNQPPTGMRFSGRFQSKPLARWNSEST